MIKRGIVYVLSNPAMPDYIKVGKTGDLKQRMASLNNTSVPFPFMCERASVVDDMDNVEKKIHSAFTDSRVNTKREFFEIDASRIIDILELVEIENITPIFVAENAEEQKEIAKAIEKNVKKRSRFNFAMVNIAVGEEIVFGKTDHEGNPIVATVANSTKINFRGEVTSLSKSADIILRELGYDWKQVAGTNYWQYQGQVLSDIRNRFEDELDDE